MCSQGIETGVRQPQSNVLSVKSQSSTPHEFRDGSQIGPRWRENLFLKLAVTCHRLVPRSVLVRVWALGDALRHLDRQRKLSGDSRSLVLRREQIWDVIIHRLQSVDSPGISRGKPFTSAMNAAAVTLEFGVAFGYSSDYFLRRMESVSYLHFGFDSFKGLARGFREFRKGAFSTEGAHPNIEDSRVTWVVGDVLDTVSATFLQRCIADSSVAVFFFDLDLYEPTEHVLRQVLQVARVGDIFYFDEPLDAEESVIVDRLLAGAYGSFQLDVLCSSPISAAYTLKSKSIAAIG